jgi:CBS domain-containing protein
MVKVSEIMAKNLITANRRDPIKMVVKKMEEHGLRCIPIVDGGKIVGLLSHGDIVRKIILEGMSDFSQTIAFMSTSFVTVTPDDDMEKVLKLMDEKHVRRVPVVEKGILVGLITQTDIIKYEACMKCDLRKEK